MACHPVKLHLKCAGPYAPKRIQAWPGLGQQTNDSFIRLPRCWRTSPHQAKSGRCSIDLQQRSVLRSADQLAVSLLPAPIPPFVSLGWMTGFVCRRKLPERPQWRRELPFAGLQALSGCSVESAVSHAGWWVCGDRRRYRVVEGIRRYLARRTGR
ncbi:hypothetical protein Brsp05_03037 [Brucella sp. NBRC 12953]